MTKTQRYILSLEKKLASAIEAPISDRRKACRERAKAENPEHIIVRVIGCFDGQVREYTNE